MIRGGIAGVNKEGTKKEGTISGIHIKSSWHLLSRVNRSPAPLAIFSYWFMLMSSESTQNSGLLNDHCSC